MKCFIKSFILGLEPSENDVCTIVNPIVRSLVTSAMFVVFMAVAGNLIHI